MAEPVHIEAASSEAHYSGHFSAPAFDLLANPIPVYKQLLAHLSPFGANLNALKVDTANLPDANVSCSLLSLNALIRVRLDRFDLSFLKFNEVGLQVADKILLSSWQALVSTGVQIAIGEHSISLSATFQMKNANQSDFMKRFVRIPEAFSPTTSVGMGFYLGGNQRSGTKYANLIVDRGNEPDLMLLKIDMGFDGAAIPTERLTREAEEYSTFLLRSIDLTWDE